MAILPKDKIKAAEKIRDDIDNFRAKKKAGSAVAAVAEKYGLNRTTAQNYLKLLSLSQGAQMHVSMGRLAMRNALAILKAPITRQDYFADLAVNANLNREEIVKRILLSVKPLEDGLQQQKVKGESNPDVKRLVESISENLSTPIQIEHGESGEGVVIVRIYFIHIFTLILGDESKLENCQCQIDASIDMTKPDQQKGIIKFFFESTLQKYQIIKLLAEAAKNSQQR